ncbi:MAG: hypothetical protein ABIH35_02865 [Patescibacteria group bacterium]
MQTELNFSPRRIERPAEFISFKSAQTVLTILAIAVAFFAILELALS